MIRRKVMPQEVARHLSENLDKMQRPGWWGGNGLGGIRTRTIKRRPTEFDAIKRCRPRDEVAAARGRFRRPIR